MADDSNPFRSLPRVDALIAGLAGATLPRIVVADIARAALEQARSELAAGRSSDPSKLAADLARAVARTATLPVINATGVLLHTNLGRAPLAPAAADAARLASVAYTNLELDLTTGERGGRGDYLRRLLRALTGAEDALVVNNNAAAVLLALTALATGRAVPVGRGELIEIGGSYRLPDVMKASGARLVEVGTTNRTRVGDYVTALQLHECGAILKVHPSNYRVEGFSEEAPLADLVDLGRTRGVPVIHDIGSGLLDRKLTGNLPWLVGEPAARESIEAGADLVTFSGDKLLGGPQAGIVVGTAAAVSALRTHPMARALRVSAPVEAALVVTMEAYAQDRIADIPFWRMALTPSEDLERRSAGLASRLGGTVRQGASVVGAGSAPGAAIPGPQVVLAGADRLFDLLLAGDPPVLARRHESDLVFDLRAVDPEQDDQLAEVVARCL